MGGLLVYWFGRQTCDQQVASSTPSHALMDYYGTCKDDRLRLVNHLGM